MFGHTLPKTTDDDPNVDPTVDPTVDPGTGGSATTMPLPRNPGGVTYVGVPFKLGGDSTTTGTSASLLQSMLQSALGTSGGAMTPSPSFGRAMPMASDATSSPAVAAPGIEPSRGLTGASAGALRGGGAADAGPGGSSILQSILAQLLKQKPRVPVAPIAPIAGAEMMQ